MLPWRHNSVCPQFAHIMHIRVALQLFQVPLKIKGTVVPNNCISLVKNTSRACLESLHMLCDYF